MATTIFHGSDWLLCI